MKHVQSTIVIHGLYAIVRLVVDGEFMIAVQILQHF